MGGKCLVIHAEAVGLATLIALLSGRIGRKFLHDALRSGMDLVLLCCHGYRMCRSTLVHLPVLRM